MRCTYGIVASLLQQFYFAVFRTFESSRAQQAIVVVHTSAFKLQQLAIEAEALVGTYLNLTNAKLLLIFVNDLITFSEGNLRCIEVWILQ